MAETDVNGFVYILTNPSFKDDWIKIGKSSRAVSIRSKELDNTSTPLPFEIYATLQTEKFNEVELKIHKMIDRLTDLRIRKNREFFNIKPEVALDIFRDIAELIDGEVLTIYKNGVPYIVEMDGVQKIIKDEHTDEFDSIEIEEENEKHAKASRFKFSMIGLNPGDIIEFTPTGELVEVFSDSKIIHKGNIYTMSAYCKEFMPDSMKIPSGAYQGPKFFNINGVSLVDLRNNL